jgi:hypothetical protein
VGGDGGEAGEGVRLTLIKPQRWGLEVAELDMTLRRSK